MTDALAIGFEPSGESGVEELKARLSKALAGSDALAYPSEIAPGEIEALKAQRSAASPYGQMSRELERGRDIVAEQERFRSDPQVYQDIGEAAFPGLSIPRHIKSGEYEEAAKMAAAQALPLGLGRLGPTALKAATGLYTAGMAMAPGATGGALIDSLPKEERAGYADQLRQAQKIKDSDARRSEIARINTAITTRVNNIRDTEKLLETNRAAAEKWLKDNAASIDSLDKDAAKQVRSANPGDRPGILNKFLEEKRKAGQTFAEKHEDIFDPLRFGVLGASFLVPGISSVRRANSLAEAERAAATALKESKKGRMTAQKKADLELARDALAEKVGGRPVDLKEMALGSLAPYGAGVFAPNSIDIMSRLPSVPVPQFLGGSGESSKPEDWEMVKRAGWAMVNPGALVPLGEGAIASGVGRWAGGAVRDWGDTMGKARGTLATLTREEQKRIDAAAKAASTRAANKAKKSVPVVLPAAGAAALPYVDPLEQQ